LRASIKRFVNFCGLYPPSGGEPLGGIAARRAAISRGSAKNEFQLFPTNTTKDDLPPRSGAHSSLRRGGQFCKQIKWLLELIINFPAARRLI